MAAIDTLQQKIDALKDNGKRVSCYPDNELHECTVDEFAEECIRMLNAIESDGGKPLHFNDSKRQ